jgi:thiamine-phosphate pyrophosphorylase
MIYLITRGHATPENFVESREQILDIVRKAVEEHVPLVQIREKALNARQLFQLTRDAAEITRGTATKLLVNDRFDIALAAGADGVQLTSVSLPADVVRGQVPDGSLIGVSIHNREEETSDADFAVFGPVFETPGKDAVGLSQLGAICAVSDVPVIAIGGVDETNLRSVIDAGAAGFAAIRSLNDADSLRRIVNLVRQ